MPYEFESNVVISPASHLSSLLLGDTIWLPTLIPKTIAMQKGELLDVITAMKNVVNPIAKVVVYSDIPNIWRRAFIATDFIQVKDNFVQTMCKQVVFRELCEEPEGAVNPPTNPSIVIIDSDHCEYNEKHHSLNMNAVMSSFIIFAKNTCTDTAVKISTNNKKTMIRRKYIRIEHNPRVNETAVMLDRQSCFTLAALKAVDTQLMPPLYFSCHVITKGTVEEAMQDMTNKNIFVSRKIAIFYSGKPEIKPYTSVAKISESVPSTCGLAVFVELKMVLENRFPLQIIARIIKKQFPELCDGVKTAIKLLQIETPVDDDNSHLLSGVIRKLPSEWVVQTPV